MLLPPVVASDESLVAPSAQFGRSPHRAARGRSVKVGGRSLRTTPVFDTYWRFAVARQHLYFDRLRGVESDQDDPILSQHRFTNCYRASDRVSQFAISPVAYPAVGAGRLDERDVIFRVLLFKVFNRIDTWQSLERELGTISWRDWNPQRARAALDSIWRRGGRVYSAAYVIPPPRLGGLRKHEDHLLLLETLMDDGVADEIQHTRSLRELFTVLRSKRSFGDFLAYQYAIDLNYSSVVDFDENSFVMPGPGARDGIRKCFGAESVGSEAELIAYMVESQDEHFERLSLSFPGLGGRSLHLIDCQNLFCEIDKYARVAHPDIAGISGRTRIKQNYKPDPAPMPRPWFPPKWGINEALGRQLEAMVEPENPVERRAPRTRTRGRAVLAG